MKATNDTAEFLHHHVERRSQSGAAPNQDVIVPVAKYRWRGETDEFAQTAAHAVAFYGVADLPGDREADPRRSGPRAYPDLQDKCAGVRSRALPGSLSNGPKITPAF
jgi:hypothetical protein